MNFSITKICSIILILCASTGTLYGGFSYASGIVAQVTANTTSILLQRWQVLETKREKQGLTPKEKFEYCQISQQLKYQGTGCAIAQ